MAESNLSNMEQDLDFDNALKDLEKNYDNVNHPISFLSPQKIYGYYKKKIPLKTIKNVVAKYEGYTLLKPERKTKIHTPTLSFYVGDLIQADLFYVDRLAEYNKGVKYILSCICVHSKFAYLETMTTKTAQETKEKLSLILERMPTKPNAFAFDMGKEFKNDIVEKFLKNLGIKTFFTLAENKCAVVEKFQRTFQKSLYTYLVQKETFIYIDVLENLLNNYNNTVHTTIKMTPAQALLPSNKILLEEAHAEIKSKRRLKKVQPIYKKNQRVRVSLKKNKFTRSYDVSNSYEEYIIHEILTDRIVPYYILKDWKNRILTGKFLQNQLQPVDIDKHRGTPIKERTKNGKKQILFSFKGYDESFNEWIDAEDVSQIK